MERNIFDLATRITIGVILLLCPVFFSLWPSWSLNYGKELLFQFLVVLLASIWAAGSVARGCLGSRLASLHKQLRLPLLLALGSLLLATLLSRAPFEARATFLNTVLGVLFLVVLAERLKTGAIRPGLVLWVITLTAVINASMAIAQSFGWDPIFAIPIEEVGESLTFGRRKVMGFLGNPVFLSEYVASSLPLVLGLLLVSRSKLKKTLIGIVLALFILAVLLSMTRAGAISIIISFGAFLLMLSVISRGTLRLGSEKLTVAFLFLGVALIYAIALAKYAPLVERYSEQGSLNKRFSIWSNTLSMIKESPVFGLGLGSFKFLYLDSQVQENIKKMQALPPQVVGLSPQGGLAHAHNEYLQLAQETGAIGCFALSFFLVSLFGLGLAASRRALRQSGDRRTINACIIVAAALTGIISILINALTGFPFHIAPTAAVGLTCAALVVGLSPRAFELKAATARQLSLVRTAPGRQRLIRGSLSLVLLGVGIALLVLPTKALMADYH